MKMLKLKNGAEEAQPLVMMVMQMLQRLAEEKPILLIDFAMKCRDASYEICGGEDELAALSLIKSGYIHDSVRNIVLSAVTGEGAEMALGDPIDRESAAS